jgi:DNA-binding MarR family transcriptional regulator
MPSSAGPAERDLTDLPDVLQFMRLLWAVVHGLERRSKRMTTELGVTGPQRLVLRVVGLFPGLSAGELAATLHVHPSTLTGILQRLTSQKLLSRVNDVTDRRRAILRLAPLGARVNRARRETVESAVGQALARLAHADRAATRRVLARLTAHLDPPAGPAASSRRRRRPRR